MIQVRLGGRRPEAALQQELAGAREQLDAALTDLETVARSALRPPSWNSATALRMGVWIVLGGTRARAAARRSEREAAHVS